MASPLTTTRPIRRILGTRKRWRFASLSRPVSSRAQRSVLAVATLIVSLCVASGSPGGERVDCRILVRGDDGQPLPCTLYLRDPADRPIAVPGAPFWKDHSAIDGEAALKLTPGSYSYQIERGPEYERSSGTWTVAPGDSAETLSVMLRRRADLGARSWYSGDLHIHRPIEQASALLRAADLDVGPFITWWNAQSLWSSKPIPRQRVITDSDGRTIDILAGEDERGGGALLYFGLKRPLPITAADREYPSSVHFLRDAQARSPGCHVDAEKPFWKDMPLWLSTGWVDSIGLANNHQWRSGMLDNEAWGEPRDRERFPPPAGNGQWSEYLYHQILNAGFQIPPSAGSASGVLPNPVGYNRCYVYLPDGLDYDGWWDGLQSGRVFVTNGPLITVTIDDRPPGSTLRNGKQVVLRARLQSADPIGELQVIHNGTVLQELAVSDASDQVIETTLRIPGPGWVLVRATADHPSTHRFASTGPFYIPDSSGRQPIDASAVGFFLHWAQRRRADLAKSLDGIERDEVLSEHDAAIEFWKRRGSDSE